MTEQEALEIITNIVQSQNVTKENDLALAIAQKAIEKQMPKKPVKKNPICYEKTNDRQEHYAYDYYCLKCNKELELQEHHCPCGQNIDWS